MTEGRLSSVFGPLISRCGHLIDLPVRGKLGTAVLFSLREHVSAEATIVCWK